MSFCTFDSVYIMDTHTAVDNVFITEFMPDAPKSVIAVYLYGLYLAGNVHNADNSIEIMSRVLNLTPDDIIDCFTYLEGFSLVSIIHKKPLEVKYLSTRNGKGILKKINPGKYKDFNVQIQMQLAGRMIEPNEYSEYYSFLEQSFMEPEALVMIAKYCADLKGETVGHHYILTVARNLANAGYKTVETVEQKLANHSRLNPVIEPILKALGLRRQVDYEDRAAYQKWADFGFSDETILKVAKSCKGGGMKKLDTQLSEYYKFGLLTIKEIEDFRAAREQNYALAKAVNKAIGVYYESLDNVVETYISVWKGYGFSDDTLQSIAKYCFVHNVRTLEGMNAAVDKFRRAGLVTDEAIAQHVGRLSESDGIIKTLLDTLGLLRQVTAADRASYKTWSETWDMPDELILFAAEKSRGATSPVQYLNRILSDWKAKGIKTLAAAKAEAAKFESGTGKPDAPAKQGIYKHEYTKEQLDALFDDIDNLKF